MKRKSIHKSKNTLIKTKVGDILFTSSGGTPDTNQKAYWTNGNIPWINSGELKGEIITRPTAYITEVGLQNSSAKLFPKNTVLIAITGSNIGKVGILGFECSTNQSIVGIYPSRNLNPLYIYYYFQYIRKRLINLSIGSAQPHINKRVIDETLIPVMPINYQNYIINYLEDFKLKELNIIEKAKEIEKLENEAFLHYVSQKRNLFSRRIHLNSICTERKERIKTKWKGKRLIGVSKEHGIVDLKTTGKKSFERYKVVKPGDFIYNPMRIDIGSIAIYDENAKSDAITSPDYIVFSAAPNISKLLLLKFFKSDYGISIISSNTQGSVRSRLYFKNLGEIEFPYTTTARHKEANDVLQGFSTLREELKKAIEEVSRAKYYSLQKAFSGELTAGLKYENTAIEIRQLLKEEKLEIVFLNNLKTDRKRKIMKRKRKNLEIDILEIIESNFGRAKFRFEDLYSVSELDYEVLKSEIYKHIGSNLILEFDKKTEKMFIKIKQHEN